MKVIILAAGIGSRLKPLTDLKPKCLVRIAGVSIIERQILAYKNAGINESDIYVIVGYKASDVIKCTSKKFGDVNFINNVHYETTNNMYSLYLGLKEVDIENGICISNGDCVYSDEIVSSLINSPYEDLIVAQYGHFSTENMKIKVNDEKIIGISKQYTEAEAYGNSIDLYKFRKVTTEYLQDVIKYFIEQKKDTNQWTEVAINKLFRDNKILPLDIQKQPWGEIDNFKDLHEADILFSQLNVKNKKCFIFDLDGTVYLGNNPIEGTIKFIKDNSELIDFYFMTNNTSKTPDDYIRKLGNFGISVEPLKILTPLTPLINYLKNNNINSIYILSNDKVRSYILSNLTHVKETDDPDKCEAVILCYDTDVTYKKIVSASKLLRNNSIHYLATHSDKVCPTEYGPIPDIGCLISLFETSNNRKPDVIFGKPNLDMFDLIVDKYVKKQVVMVGDRLYTDKVLAGKLNIDFILVLSGESNRIDVEAENSFPALIVNDLSEV